MSKGHQGTYGKYPGRKPAWARDQIHGDITGYQPECVDSSFLSGSSGVRARRNPAELDRFFSSIQVELSIRKVPTDDPNLAWFNDTVKAQTFLTPSNRTA